MRGWPLLLLALWAGGAAAHKPSDSYLALRVEGARVAAQWDIALRDLDYAIGLDADDNGEITWGELRARHPDIAAYALARLRLSAAGGACPLRAGEQLVDRHSDGAYAVLRFEAQCPGEVKRLEAAYSLFFELDPQHRGLLRLEFAGQTVAAVFGPQQPALAFDLAEASALRQFLDYGGHGVWHIWVGYDHILFLLALLLPAVLLRVRRHWEAAPGFGPAFWEVFKVVTAFTVAHSITLSLAALAVVQLPARLVESAIAASVLLAALNNLYPVVLGRRWAVAFGFGLVHGFGFASVLADLGLPQGALLVALVGFNLGVELGQLAIVCPFLPLAYWLRDTFLYRRLLFGGGSAAIAAVACAWLAERLFGLKLLPF